jgi:adenylate kinase
MVVSLTCDDEEVLRRITGRRSCPQCGAIYHVEFKPPTVEDLCDSCGHKGLQQRTDDKAEVVAERLTAYRRQTAPLIDYYREKGLLWEIDGGQPIDAIQQELLAAVGAPTGE